MSVTKKTPKIKLGIVLPAMDYFSPLNSGPLARGVFERYKYLEEDADMTIFCRPSGSQWARDIPCKYMYTPLLSKLPYFRRHWLRIFPWEVALRMKGGYQVAYVHDNPIYAIRIRQLNPNIKVVLHMHSDRLKLLDEVRFNRVVNSVDLIVTISNYIKEGIVGRCPNVESKVRVIHNGINTEMFTPSWNGDGQREPVILFVGRLTEKKGAHFLLEAMERVVSHTPQARLLIVGSPAYGRVPGTPYVEKLKQQAAKLGDNVAFTGYVKNEDLPAVHREVAIFVCPSVWDEPLSLATLEAMASGLPVIASKRGGIPEAVGDAGILYDAEDAGSLANNIIALLRDKERRVYLGRKARERAEHLFTWARNASEIKAVLKELV